jgi:iron complex outermembrane receptor protein
LSVFHKRVATGLTLNAAGVPQAAPGIQPNFDQGVFDRYLALLAAGQSPTAAAANAVVASNGVFFRTSTDEKDLSGKFAAQFDLSPDHMLYGSYTRGYKGPAFNIFFNLNATGTNVIEAETSDAFEIGLKNTLLDGRMTLNIALFRADYHDFQANNPDVVAGVVVTRFTNAGEVSTRGVEVDVNWRPFDDFTLNGGVAYTKAIVDRFNAPPGSNPSQIIPGGTSLQYAPRWKGALNADYRVRTGGPVDVWLGASTNFQSKQLSVFGPNEVQRELGTIPKYALVNAQIGIGDPDERYRLTFQVRNLTDKEYPAQIVTGGPGGSYRYQIPRDADRYYGVTGRVNF